MTWPKVVTWLLEGLRIRRDRSKALSRSERTSYVRRVDEPTRSVQDAVRSRNRKLAINRAHQTHHKQVTIPLILGAHQTLVHRAPDQFLSGKPEASNAWNHSHSGWHTNSPDMHKSCNTRPHNLSKIKREPTLLKNSWNANIQKIRPIIKQTRHRMFPRLTQGATGGMAPSEPPGNPYSVCHNKFNNCNFI